MNQRYLTTPIYYASGEPHLGHAYTTVLTDFLARYYRQTGSNVLFLTGTDEHGQKMQDAATEKSIEPIELADQMVEKFKIAWNDLNISYDRFIRTTETDHIAVVTTILEDLWEKNQIYKDIYSGWYCKHEERYWTDSDVGPDKVCPDCKRTVGYVEEENYFFRMSNYQKQLIQHIKNNPQWIVPETRKNEILGFLAHPLKDLSISRPKSRLKWGITLPFDNDHVCYVWIDALINYVTGSGSFELDKEKGQLSFTTAQKSWWPADLHIIGKDILTTHAVYWPTILMAAGLELPKQILSHGWWIMGDTKMSKSIGNVVDPLTLRDHFGTDGIRWYLLRDMPTGDDATYNFKRFSTRYEELANVFGNLASRVTSMIVRYRNGVVPKVGGSGLDTEIQSTLEAVTRDMGNFRIHNALGATMDLARTANGYIDIQEPWAQAKKTELQNELDDTLATLFRTLTVLNALFFPIIPEKMTDLAMALGLDGVPTIEEAMSISPGGHKVSKVDPLFPKINLDA